MLLALKNLSLLLLPSWSKHANYGLSINRLSIFEIFDNPNAMLGIVYL